MSKTLTRPLSKLKVRILCLISIELSDPDYIEKEDLRAMTANTSAQQSSRVTNSNDPILLKPQTQVG